MEESDFLKASKNMKKKKKRPKNDISPQVHPEGAESHSESQKHILKEAEISATRRIP